MNRRSFVRTASLAATGLVWHPSATYAAATAPATAPAPQSSWVSSWFASPQPLWDTAFVLPTGMPAQVADQTLRETVKISLGGKRLRVVLSNRYGTQPLVIGAARVARARAGRPLTLCRIASCALAVCRASRLRRVPRRSAIRWICPLPP